MNGKIKSVALLSGGFFLMILLHHDVFGFSTVDIIYDSNREEQAAHTTKNKISLSRQNTFIAGMILESQDETMVSTNWVSRVHARNNYYFKKPYPLLKKEATR